VSDDTYPVEVGTVPKQRSKDDEIRCSCKTSVKHFWDPGLFDSFREERGFGLPWEPVVEILEGERVALALASEREETVRRRTRRKLTG